MPAAPSRALAPDQSTAIAFKTASRSA
jgi:hypothetical protein